MTGLTITGTGTTTPVYEFPGSFGVAAGTPGQAPAVQTPALDTPRKAQMANTSKRVDYRIISGVLFMLSAGGLAFVMSQ
jgi:hypothetical protein